MHLLMIIIEDENDLRLILDRFYEEDIGGATVLDSIGMGHIMAEHISIFARFADLTKDEGKYNKTIFTLVENEEKREKAVKIVEEIVGDLEAPNTGMYLSLPVEKAKGFKSKLK